MLHLWLGVTPADAAAPASELRPPHLPAACLIDERIASYRFVAYAWPPELASRARVSSAAQHRLQIGPSAPEQALRSCIAPHLDINRRSGLVHATLPATSTTPLFYATHTDSFWIASDPRWLPVPKRTLDPRGLYALLQFGAMPAPLTLWHEIRRLTPGSVTRFAPGTARSTRKSAAWPTSPAARIVDAQARAEHVAELLDSLLGELCPDRRPVILFSGGVDSGLLAARCARLGWRDTLLVCYRLGPEDPQPEWATHMARELGLRLRIVPAQPPDWPAILAALPSAYPEPVGDFGTVPAYDLACHVHALAGDRRTVLDGSGADALFRTFPALARWRRLYALPKPLRCAAGKIWRAGGGWRAAHRGSRWLAAARISCSMPYELASMIAENPLAALAYPAPGAIRRDVQAAFADNLTTAFPELADPLRSRALDLLQVVCALTVQKNAPLFLGSKLDLIYPFLHPELVNAAFSWAQTPIEGQESKGILKRLLARDLREALVQQPKRGMTPNMRLVLSQSQVAKSLAAAVHNAPESAARFVDTGLLKRMLRLSAAGEPLPHTTYNFIWTACCALLWLAGNSAAGDAV